MHGKPSIVYGIHVGMPEYQFVLLEFEILLTFNHTLPPTIQYHMMCLSHHEVQNTSISTGHVSVCQLIVVEL